MQKYDTCEICGKRALVADYGLKGEYICIDCSLRDELSEHVAEEMIRRHGIEAIRELTADALGKVTKH